MHRKIIVTTSINPPTEALLKFAKMKNWKLLVVGDLKTPKDFRIDNAIYMGPDEQEKSYKKLSDLIGWNCIQRRNIGFIRALELGAEAIATVDDDNIPYSDWENRDYIGRPIVVSEFNLTEEIFDPISVTEHKKLWHRGFPLQALRNRNLGVQKTKKTLEFDVDAGFWNGDPDIDAFCRLEHYPDVEFDASNFPFTSNRIGPFNSQNTILSRRAIKEYFCFPGVGRMDDIWGSYLLQARGYKCVYTEASVFQDRNVHDLTKDLVGEFLGYENNLEFARQVQLDPEIALTKFIPQKSLEAFNEYRRLADER